MPCGCRPVSIDARDGMHHAPEVRAVEPDAARRQRVDVRRLHPGDASG